MKSITSKIWFKDDYIIKKTPNVSFVTQTEVTKYQWMHIFSLLQLLNKELREAKSAKMKTNVTPDTQTSSLQSSHQNHLPQSLPDTAASAQKASSALPGAPSADASPPASAKPHLGGLIP